MISLYHRQVHITYRGFAFDSANINIFGKNNSFFNKKNPTPCGAGFFCFRLQPL